MHFLLDGRTLEAKEGETLLAVLDRERIELPHVCFKEGLAPVETCETCLVECDGRLVRACSTRVSEGLSFSVLRAAAAREEAMGRLLREHQLVCSVCDKNGDCELHRAALISRIRTQAYRPKGYPPDDSNPFYRYDPDHCILCGRCVEACQDLVVNEVLTMDWKADPPRVVWGEHDPINESSCVSCGACVTVCPVDALMPKTFVGQGGYLTGLSGPVRSRLIGITKAVEPALGGFRAVLRASELEARARTSLIRKTKTVCPFCGVGCTFDAWTRGNRLLKVQPRPEGPANGLATCVKGKFGLDFLRSPDRLTHPLLREGGQLREVPWDRALDAVVSRLKEIVQRFGPDAVGVIANCTGSNEEAYLTQKLARAVLGTHNVDNCARYCQAPATTGLFRTVGIGGDAGSLEDVAGADLVITFGSNTAESHPVLASKIKRARKLNGQRLVVVDPRRQWLADHADQFVCPRSGTDVFLLNALARLLLDRDWVDRPFLEARVNGLPEFAAALGPFTLEEAERVTGVPRKEIEELAERVHAARSVAILWAMGVTQHQSGSETSTAISNLLLLTGNYGRPHTGAYPLRGHANVQGTSDFGCLPAFLPGYERTDDPAVMAKYGSAWGVPLPTRRGLTSTEMVEAALDGKLKALLIFGEDKLLADAREDRTARALSGLSLLVVTELFRTRTAELAHVVLPAAASLEKEGTFVNTERRIQRFYPALDPPGEAREELWILQEIARRLGAPWRYGRPAEVMEEVSGLAGHFAGVTYDRLEGYRSLQWPVDREGRDSPVLYRERFEFPDGKARLVPAKWLPALAPDGEYDCLLDNGRMLEHFHWGNLTWRSPGLAEKVPEVLVEVPIALAEERGIGDGDWVRVRSSFGGVKARAVRSSRVTGRTLYLAIHGREEAAVNRLTTAAQDPVTRTPAYKEVPVALERIPTETPGPSPRRRNDPRLHATVPQVGIRVEERRARPEYSSLADGKGPSPRGGRGAFPAGAPEELSKTPPGPG